MPLAASFRDPAGHLFEQDGQLYRQINACYFSDYQALMEGGLYQALTERSLLIRHRERPELAADDTSLIIQPEYVRYISYP